MVETPKQTGINGKTYFLVGGNKPKNNRNRLSFGSLRFKPKIFVVCFEDTLSRETRRKKSVASQHHTVLCSDQNPVKKKDFVTKEMRCYITLIIITE